MSSSAIPEKKLRHKQLDFGNHGTPGVTRKISLKDLGESEVLDVDKIDDELVGLTPGSVVTVPTRKEAETLYDSNRTMSTRINSQQTPKKGSAGSPVVKKSVATPTRKEDVRSGVHGSPTSRPRTEGTSSKSPHSRGQYDDGMDGGNPQDDGHHDGVDEGGKTISTRTTCTTMAATPTSTIVAIAEICVVTVSVMLIATGATVNGCCMMRVHLVLLSCRTEMEMTIRTACPAVSATTTTRTRGTSLR